MKKIYFLLFYLFSMQAFCASDLIPLNCIGDFKKFTHTIDELELYPNNPSTKIRLSDLSEYNGPIPPTCHNEYGNNGQLRIITSRNKILIFELVLRNKAPVITKYISNIAPIEIGLKRHKIAGSGFKTNLDFPLQFTIQKENDGEFLEILRYKNTELNQYE